MGCQIFQGQRALRRCNVHCYYRYEGVGGGPIFRKIALYWHVKLSPESSYKCTFHTPWGRNKALPMHAFWYLVCKRDHAKAERGGVRRHSGHPRHTSKQTISSYRRRTKRNTTPSFRKYLSMRDNRMSNSIPTRSSTRST